jgi:hypothetical protein
MCMMTRSSGMVVVEIEPTVDDGSLLVPQLP